MYLLDRRCCATDQHRRPAQSIAFSALPPKFLAERSESGQAGAKESPAGCNNCKPFPAVVR